MNRTTTHKLFAILLSLIVVLGMMPVSVFAVELSIITGNSVYRSSATEATVKLLSDTNGTAFYKITDSITAPSASDLTVWTNAGEVTAGTTKSINLSGLTAGARSKRRLQHQ